MKTGQDLRKTRHLRKNRGLYKREELPTGLEPGQERKLQAGQDLRAEHYLGARRDLPGSRPLSERLRGGAALRWCLAALLAAMLCCGCAAQGQPGASDQAGGAGQVQPAAAGQSGQAEGAEDAGAPETASAPGTAEPEAPEEAPERVVALSKSNAELWLLVGGALAGTSEDAMELEGISPETVSLGDMDHVSLEAVAALEPDLLILFSTDPAQRALGEAAEGIGIPVLFTNIDSFADYREVMLDLTQRTGREDLFRKNVEEVEAEIEKICAQVPRDAGERTYLFLHISATKSKVEKNDYFACEILNALGLSNIAADSSAFDELSMEQIAAGDPDYIFLVPRGDEEKAMESFDGIFRSNPAWESLTAVREGHFYLLSKELFGLKPNGRWAESYGQAYSLLYGE